MTTAADENPNENAASKVVEDLMCPITHDLPWDPVTAMDGFHYERSAIEGHFANQQQKNGSVKSPLTNEVIGTKLLPAVRIKNIIQVMVETNVIVGDLAENWKKKKLMSRAEGGDIEAIENVAYNYYYGDDSFDRDYEKSFHWCRKAHDAGRVWGTCMVGKMLVNGEGAPQDKTKGLVFLGMAASNGSQFAAYHLGTAFADGKHGLVADKAEAIRLLKFCLDDSVQKADITCKEKVLAQMRLDDLSILDVEKS